MLDTEEVWNPQVIVNDLKFIDRILSYMDGAALASEAKLTKRMTKGLSAWAKSRNRAFPMAKTDVRSAAIELSVLN